MPWLKQSWCLPEAPSAGFVWHMEDVLGVYTRPYDPKRPQVCLDEGLRMTSTNAVISKTSRSATVARDAYPVPGRGAAYEGEMSPERSSASSPTGSNHRSKSRNAPDSCNRRRYHLGSGGLVAVQEVGQ